MMRVLSNLPGPLTVAIMMLFELDTIEMHG
jgi:hypothetical protein